MPKSASYDKDYEELTGRSVEDDDADEEIKVSPRIKRGRPKGGERKRNRQNGSEKLVSMLLPRDFVDEIESLAKRAWVSRAGTMRLLMRQQLDARKTA